MTTQTDTDETTHGVDGGAHLEFIDWMANNPESALLEFQSTGTSEAVANRTTATIGEWKLAGEPMGETREHVLRFGLPPELETEMGYTEATDRYEAIEATLAALTACINGTICYNAIRDGITVDDIETTVRVPVDLRLLFGIHDFERADEMYGELQLEITVTGPKLSAEESEQLSSYPARSPVYNLLTRPQTETVELTVRPS